MYKMNEKVFIEKLDDDSIVLQKEDKTYIINDTTFYIYDNITKHDSYELLVDQFFADHNINDISKEQVLEDFKEILHNLLQEELLIC